MIMQSLLPKWKNFSTGVSGALDWAELSSIDIEEFMEEYPEYDAMILDEGGDPNGEGGVAYRGISFLALNGGTQIKMQARFLKRIWRISKSPSNFPARWTASLTMSFILPSQPTYMRCLWRIK